MKGYQYWVGLWAWLWGMVLIKLIDMERPNTLLFVAPFPTTGGSQTVKLEKNCVIGDCIKAEQTSK